MASFPLPWVHSRIQMTPNPTGGASLQIKIMEIQKQSIAEKMFSMILPFQDFRELLLSYFDLRLNLGKTSLSRNTIRTDTETHAIGKSKNLKDRYLCTFDILMRLPAFPTCLTKLVSDIIYDSWEERFIMLRDSLRSFGKVYNASRQLEEFWNGFSRYP